MSFVREMIVRPSNVPSIIVTAHIAMSIIVFDVHLVSVSIQMPKRVVSVNLVTALILDVLHAMQLNVWIAQICYFNQYIEVEGEKTEILNFL